MYTSDDGASDPPSEASPSRLWKLGVGLAGVLTVCFLASVVLMVLALPGTLSTHPQQTCFAGLKTLPRPSPPAAVNTTGVKSQ